MRENPCLTCGACCATLRVSFYWAEADPQIEDSVPLELTEPLTPQMRCMKGTNDRPPRCVALQGEVGAPNHCAIYTRRPSPCRAFGVTWVDGQIVTTPEELARCNKARARWGLAELETASNGSN